MKFDRFGVFAGAQAGATLGGPKNQRDDALALLSFES
jgi:hypothetical protein